MKLKQKQLSAVETGRVPKWASLTAIFLLTLIVACAQGGAGSGAAGASTPFNGERAFEDLKRMIDFGPRPAGSDAIEKTRNYIVKELEKAGLTPVLDSFEGKTPKGPIKMVNIRAIRKGIRPSTLAVSGHYDTKLFDFKFDGASDGGSSAAWLLEMARVTSDLKLENSLEFIFFDGEEAVVEWTDDDSIYGSRFDVDRRKRAGNLKDLKALILVDMIGDKALNIRREANSTRWLTTAIWNTAHSLGFTKEFLNESIAIEDDHKPYLQAGIEAVDIIDFDYPHWHQPTDTLDKTSARSLKVVGDVVYTALPEIDKRAGRQ